MSQLLGWPLACQQMFDAGETVSILCDANKGTGAEKRFLYRLRVRKRRNYEPVDN